MIFLVFVILFCFIFYFILFYFIFPLFNTKFFRSLTPGEEELRRLGDLALELYIPHPRARPEAQLYTPRRADLRVPIVLQWEHGGLWWFRVILHSHKCVGRDPKYPVEGYGMDDQNLLVSSL